MISPESHLGTLGGFQTSRDGLRRGTRLRPTRKLTRGATLALLMLATAATGLRAAPARATDETRESSLNLALAAPPAASRTVALVKTPRATDDDAPVATPAAAAHTTWWPWALIAAGAGAVAALIFINSGRDPACPAGRTCK